MTEPLDAPPLDQAVQAIARLSRVMERAAQPLSLADYRALAAILAGEARASRLAQRLAVGKPSISATIDALARRGMVTRERVEADQRAIALAVTPAGREAYEQARDRMTDLLGRIVALTGDAPASLRGLAELGDALEAFHATRGGGA